MTSWRNHLLDPFEMAEIYEWVDSIPLSRPKRDIEKDFADGVLASEIVKHYFPQMVNLRNFSFARSIQERMSNWRLLNGKVFIRIGLNVPTNVMTSLSSAKTGIIEVFLYNLRESIRTTMVYRDDPLATRLLSLNTLNPLHHPLLPVTMLPGAAYEYDHHRALYDPRLMYKYNTLYPADHLYKYTDSELYRKRLLDYHTHLSMKLDTLKSSKSPRNGYATNKALISNFPNASLVEKTKEILTREVEIEKLNEKLQRMEHLLEIQDTRIKNLSTQVDKLKLSK